MRRRNTRPEFALVDLSRRIDEQIERFDAICFERAFGKSFNLDVDETLETIDRNRRLLRRLDGGKNNDGLVFPGAHFKPARASDVSDYLR